MSFPQQNSLNFDGNGIGTGQGEQMNVLPFNAQQMNQLTPQQQMQLLQMMKQRGMHPNQMNAMNLQLLQLQQQQQQRQMLFNLQAMNNQQKQPNMMMGNPQQQIRTQAAGPARINQQTMMQMVGVFNQTGLHSSPQFQTPGTPQIPKTSPSITQAGLMGMQGLAGSPPNNLLFGNQVRANVMVNNLQNVNATMLQNQRIADPQQLLARNFVMQQQKQNMNPVGNVPMRPTGMRTLISFQSDSCNGSSTYPHSQSTRA
jgi:hypothetical protein